jgi:hypothetical protein
MSRRPTSGELASVVDLYASSRDLAARDEAAARQLVGAPPISTSDDLAEVAAWVSVGRTLLNLDEFITRE